MIIYEKNLQGIVKYLNLQLDIYEGHLKRSFVYCVMLLKMFSLNV